MEVSLYGSCCGCFPLRTGCLVIGCFDVVYGHVMIFVYLLSMYTGYFQVAGTYKAALWLDFVFTIVQLLSGIVLVYGVKYKTTWLVLLSSVVGMILVGVDVVGDILLYLSFSNATSTMILIAAVFLVSFVELGRT